MARAAVRAGAYAPARALSASHSIYRKEELAACLPDVYRMIETAPHTEMELEERLTCPEPQLVEMMGRLRGDVLILGAGGKMGPTLAVLARRAISACGSSSRVIAVSRFGDRTVAEALQAEEVEAIPADLLDRRALEALPTCENVVYLAGMKFGSSEEPGRTWAMNVLLPALVAERYRDSAIVALSTGNVYPFVSPDSGGATEDTAPAPIGEYAWSCLGRERMFQYAAERWGTRSVLVRLNYATDLRYGVLQDVARKVWTGEPVDVTMGWLNTIWQGDANSFILRALERVSAPPLLLNVTGAETISVRKAAERFGTLFGKTPLIARSEGPTALLSNARRCTALFGMSSVSTDRLLEWTADWIRSGGRSLGKPTHFEARDGRY